MPTSATEGVVRRDDVTCMVGFCARSSAVDGHVEREREHQEPWNPTLPHTSTIFSLPPSCDQCPLIHGCMRRTMVGPFMTMRVTCT